MRILENVYLVGSGQIGLSHAFDCHVYLIDGGSELALVDSGAGLGLDRILANIRSDGLDPQRIGKILLTHHHADHAGGCNGLLEHIEAQTCIHHDGVAFVETGGEEKMGLDVAKRSGNYSPDYTFAPFRVDRALDDDDVVMVGNVELKAIHVRGHSPDAVCYLLEGEGGSALFAGDVVLFKGQIGLLNRAGSNLAEYRDYFGRIASLDVDSLLPGHGLFVLSGGMQHIKSAEEALKRLQPPANFI